MIKTIFYLLFLISSIIVLSQEIDSTLLKSINTKHKKFDPTNVRLLLGVNYTYAIPLMMQNDKYIGEQKIEIDTLGGFVINNFIEYDNIDNLRNNYSASNLQLTLQANFWKNLYNGIHYQFFSIKNYKRQGSSILSRTNSFFFAIATSVGYSFEFLKKKNLHIMPTFRIGGYTADEYFDSKGKKIYIGLDCKIRYMIKNKFGFSAGVDYDFFRYKYKGFSSIHQKDTYQKTTLNNIYFNFGMAYNINIKLDK